MNYYPFVKIVTEGNILEWKYDFRYPFHTYFLCDSYIIFRFTKILHMFNELAKKWCCHHHSWKSSIFDDKYHDCIESCVKLDCTTDVVKLPLDTKQHVLKNEDPKWVRTNYIISYILCVLISMYFAQLSNQRNLYMGCPWSPFHWRTYYGQVQLYNSVTYVVVTFPPQKWGVSHQDRNQGILD
jgi:hypothetical protein